MADVHELYAEGEKLKEEGKLDEAVSKFLEAAEQDKTFALPHFALAVVYGKLGDHDKAVKHGEQACELDPGDPFTFTAMSVTYQRALAATGEMKYKQLAEDAMGRAHALQAGH